MYENDEEYLKHYHSDAYEKPSVAVDLALFTIISDTLHILTVERQAPPFMGKLSLPGTFVDISETLEEAVQRALLTKTGLKDIFFEQLYTWGGIHRDPRMRIISVSYYALVPYNSIPDAETMQFMPVAQLLEHPEAMAFDHAEIVSCGRERIRSKVKWSDIAFALVPETFTLPQLQKVYEILLGQELYKANFRKKIADKISPTEEMTKGNAHRPSRIYRKA